uniref:Uncharacterized protein n=1 Tax=Anopheles atroparvus TaxID=41427 RepID=A0A182J6Y0_ANOAO
MLKSNEHCSILPRFQYHFRCFRLHAMVFILIIEACKEKAIVAHLRKQRRLFSGVSEGIDLPSDAGTPTLTERVIQEPQAPGELIDDTLVVDGGLIIHAPGASDEL